MWDLGILHRRQAEGDVHRMQVWAGQSAALAKAQPAANLVQKTWDEARLLLRSVDT